MDAPDVSINLAESTVRADNSRVATALLAALISWIVLIVFVCAYTAPVLLVVFLTRRRINRYVGRFTLAAAFASVAIYLLVDSELANSLYGMPRHEKILIYVSSVVTLAVIGWFVGDTIVAGKTKSTGH